ncbi:MAG: ABC transporter ATP-binding protein [Candidatus Eisenbacteria bacterium]|uniref:ABC transporter ATP-binding protein n=1 Tax=Eiseniibacteriota bacterium TaxID=2212470 RepID=A0A538TPU6_UNCEI|nr:MAG: ABC transporter ATP-binding protein [Candidatus Eisenbacteria bacterium]
MNPGRAYPDQTLLIRLVREARPCWPYLLGLLTIGFLTTPLALLTPLPLKIAVDSGLGHRHLPGALRAVTHGAVPSPAAALTIAVVLLLATALLRQLLELADRVVRAHAIERLTLDLRARLFSHVQRLSLSYHDRHGTADSNYRIQKDVPDAQAIVVESLFPSITAALTLFGMIVVTARLDWQLALAALVISPVLFLTNRYYRRRFRVRWREAKNLESSGLAVVQEALAALRVVKAFGQEDWEQRRFVQRSGEGMWARIRLAAVEGRMGVQVGLLAAIGTAVVLFVGMRHVQTGVLTLGELLLIMGYIAQLYDPLKTLSRKTVGLQSKLASAERVFSLLDDMPEVVEKPGARSLARSRGHVEFDRVTFGYGDGRWALEGVSFEIPPGARVGIAGPTGAGKTTLVNLLLRFYDPSQGAIRLDGMDLREARLVDLRRQFAMVLQDPILFSTSVSENLAYGRPEASREEIVAAARAANAHEFILALPQGYDTLVGDRGMMLSGGERQRISLARAFLKDAPILILDEPTSSVDLGTEALIMEALERLTRGRTTLMIAHRLSTLSLCDIRLELERGRVVALADAAHGTITA